MFDDLAPARYAVAVYHDVNGNGRLDTVPPGLPTEPYGFSNDVGRSAAELRRGAGRRRRGQHDRGRRSPAVAGRLSEGTSELGERMKVAVIGGGWAALPRPACWARAATR